MTWTDALAGWKAVGYPPPKKPSRKDKKEARRPRDVFDRPLTRKARRRNRELQKEADRRRDRHDYKTLLLPFVQAFGSFLIGKDYSIFIDDVVLPGGIVLEGSVAL